MKKVISFVIALAVMVSMFVVPSMAYNGSDYFAAYTGAAHNGSSEYVFWFDADASDYNWDDGDNNDAADIADGGAFRGAPYVSIMRNFSTPKGVTGDENLPLWGVEDGNRYLNMNSNSRWTNDHCINNAYTLTMDVRLNGANVANKFAGIRMYTTNDSDPYAATFASGLSFNISAADATKDQLIISVANTDAELAIDLADNTFASWTTLKIVDDFAGNMVVCLGGEIVAELTIDGSSVEIAAGAETVSTTSANIHSKASFHIANLNDGDLHLDNIGVKAYAESDIPEAPATEEPATEAPATEAPATEAPATEAPATEAPATEAPATEAPATEAPATEAPATEAPATEAPATEAPATEAPATEAPATEAPLVPVTEEIDFATLPSSGSFTAAGYPEDVLFLNFASGGANDSLNHSIGAIDLSKFNTMTISYATDASAAAVGKLLLKNAAGDVIAEVVVDPCTTGWREPTTLTIDVSGATNNEELFLNLTDAANGMIIAGITLEGEAPADDDNEPDAPSTDVPSDDTDNDDNAGENNGETGDVMSFVIVIAAAALVVTVLSKKRVF